MSSYSESRSRPALPPLPAETAVIQLFSSTADKEELEICRMSDAFLKITKKIYRDGSVNPNLETHHLDLTREAVLPLYTINDHTDVTNLWQIRVIYGAEGLRPDNIEYNLLSDQDAFTFQRLVTGYSLCWRSKKVSASALEQHIIKRATAVDSVGEVQLWWSQPPESLDDDELVPGPLSPALTRRSSKRSFGDQSGSRTGSILAAQFAPSISTQLAPSVRRTSIQTDQNDRELSVTIAEPPPLLVLFGNGAASSGSNKPYHMWRVDITNLDCRDVPLEPTKLDLISSSSSKSRSGRLRPFDVHILAVQDEQSWNICRIRPGLYWRYFERHACEVLTLDFQCPEDVYHFRTSLVELQAKTFRILPHSPPLGSRSLSYSITPPETARSTPDSRNAPTVSDPPDQTEMLSGPAARQPTWWAGSPVARNFHVHREESRDRIGAGMTAG